jgi:hypothetical protein
VLGELLGNLDKIHAASSFGLTNQLSLHAGRAKCGNPTMCCCLGLYLLSCHNMFSSAALRIDLHGAVSIVELGTLP